MKLSGKLKLLFPFTSEIFNFKLVLFFNLSLINHQSLLQKKKDISRLTLLCMQYEIFARRLFKKERKRRERRLMILSARKQRDEKFDITSKKIPSLFAGFRFILARRAAENKIKRAMWNSHIFVSPSFELTQSPRQEKYKCPRVFHMLHMLPYR